MKALSDDPLVQKWWELTNPMQTPLDSRQDGKWWKAMDEVFHMN
jgi:L-rhamnose mutarotase